MTVATLTDPVTVAKRWQQRLGIGDWPALYRADPDALTAKIDVGDPFDAITLPTILNEYEVVETMLLYAYHNVPADRMPSRSQLWGAAVDLVNAWPV